MKTISVVKYLFSVFGLGFLVGAFFIYLNTSAFITEAITTEGVVVDLAPSRSNDSTTYAPVVSFFDQQGTKIEFTSSTSSNPPSYNKGEKVEVLYLPANSQDAKINGFFSLWGGAVILAGMGAIFFSIGAGIILFGIFKNRKEDYLIKHGAQIFTDFQSVELNTSVSVNGRNPFRVLTQWQNPSTSEIHIFTSNNLWFDPSSHIKDSKIKVYIEAANPKKHYVDLSFLPKVAK